MANPRELAWSGIGLVAVLVSGFLLYQQVQHISLEQLRQSLENIPRSHWLLACLTTLGAYVALAWYDRIALMHLGKHVRWRFVALCSFTTYALSHNIGASMFSGALVRFRAYRTKGLSLEEIGLVIVFCALTFVLGALLAGGVVLVMEPTLIQRLLPPIPPWLSILVGSAMLVLVLLYILGAWHHFRPRTWRKLRIEYPHFPIVLRQLMAGPLELLCAAGIIYFALPEAHHPGYVIVLGAFLASFCLALASHAPGGLGVLELTFIAALPEVPIADVLAALIVFRCFFLLIPFALSLLIMAGFEWVQWRQRDKMNKEPFSGIL